MPLDPQIQALRFQREREKAPPLYTLSVEQARQADLASVRAGAGTPESVAQVINRPIPGPAGDIPLRLYQPGGEGPFPVLIYFFGGGWNGPWERLIPPMAFAAASAMWCPAWSSLLDIGWRQSTSSLLPSRIVMQQPDGSQRMPGKSMLTPLV
jgi:hypothetical protein